MRAPRQGIPREPQQPVPAGPTWLIDRLLPAAWRALHATIGLRQKSIAAGQVRWSYLQGGCGAPVVLLHGFGVDKFSLLPLHPAFGWRTRRLAPDLPGFGQSCRSLALRYDAASQATRLIAWLDALRLERIELFGISLGGYLAAYLAALQPWRIKRLILMAPAGILPPHLSPFMRWLSEQDRNAFLFRDSAGFDLLLECMFHRPPRLPAWMKAHFVRQSLAEMPLRTKIFADLMAEGQTRLQPLLPRIAAPTLILWGANDGILDASALPLFEAGIARSRAVRIPGCGHVPYVERPGVVQAAIRRFLDESAAA